MCGHRRGDGCPLEDRFDLLQPLHPAAEIPNKEILREGFYRGCAFLFPENFRGAGLLIPVKVPHGVTFVAIQTRNRQGDARWTSLRAEAPSTLENAAQAFQVPFPSIGMTMALRQPSQQEHATAEIIRPEPKCYAASGRLSCMNYKWPARNKMLQVLAVGLDGDFYPVVTLRQCRSTMADDTYGHLPWQLVRILSYGYVHFRTALLPIALKALTLH